MCRHTQAEAVETLEPRDAGSARIDPWSQMIAPTLRTIGGTGMDTDVRVQVDASATIAALDHHADLPVLKAGVELEQGGVYLDLAHPVRGPFRALAGQVAGGGNRYVAQRDVSCDVWCHLIKSAAASAFGGLHEVDCSDLAHAGGVVPWPTTETMQPQELAAP
jgi:hypothetical protein